MSGHPASFPLLAFDESKFLMILACPIPAALLVVMTTMAATSALAAPARQYGALAIAPAGDRIASVETTGEHGKIVVRQLNGGRVIATIDPCAACSYSGLAFARDGSLAFLARDRAAGTVVLQLASGEAPPRSIATIKGIAQSPRFSPDGSKIALLVTIGAAKESGAAQAGVRQVGEIGEKNDVQRIALFDLTETVKPPMLAEVISPLSPADRYVYEYDWTPDGRGFVVTSALGNGDANWWVATLDAVDAQTGAVRRIAKPSVQMNFPRVSPDGQQVAFVGGVMSDFGSVGGDIWTVPFAGGTPTNATQNRPMTITSFAGWRGGQMLGSTLSGDTQGVYSSISARVDGMIWGRPLSLSAGDGRIVYSADGNVAATVAQGYDRAPAIYAGSLYAPVQITHDNDTVAPLASVKSIRWKNDGFDIQGWLLAPVGADPAKKAAMVTVVHGGPASASMPNFIERGATADLLAAGYYIFYPNPRGSYGQGEAFTAANKRDFGGGDLRDILAGVDAAEKAAPIDDARLGLMGGSYGGFMAMWANTQTNRFKAIISGAGLSNWISYYGTNGINEWMLPYFGKPLYADYDAYRAPSAIYQMTTAKTPTFLYVGERDIEVPPTQSVEYWHALKELGVPTSLVIYAEEGHGIRAPVNAADLRKRTVSWFDKYLAAAK